MTDYIQHIILPGACRGTTCVVDEVHSNETKTRVSLVTVGSTKPALKATVERIIELYPHVLRIRILTADSPYLCSFKLVDGSWVEQPPPLMRPRRRLSSDDRKLAISALLAASAHSAED